MRGKSASIKIAAVGLGMCCLFAVISGCGINVDLTSSPDRINQAGQVNFTMKLTNPSKCPMGTVLAVLLPFITLDEIRVSGDPEMDRLLHSFLEQLCSGQGGAPGGINCRFENGSLICDMSDAPNSSGNATVASPIGTLMTCERNGAHIICHPASIASLRRGSAARAALPPANCIEEGGVQICDVGDLAPGGMATTTLSLVSPQRSGVFDNLLIGAAQQQGVCKDGSRAGDPCDVDDDCTGGSSGSCGSGICVDNTSQATAAGCDVTGDCGPNETCVQCLPDGLAAMPIDCTQTTVVTTTPAMSMSVLAAAGIGLFAIGLVGLRLRRRIG